MINIALVVNGVIVIVVIVKARTENKDKLLRARPK
jgi:hypothetical protein